MYNFKKHRSILGVTKIILVYGPFIQKTVHVKISNAQLRKASLKTFPYLFLFLQRTASCPHITGEFTLIFFHIQESSLNAEYSHLLRK